MKTDLTFADFIAFAGACAATFYAPPVGFWYACAIFIGVGVTINFLIEVAQQ